jgi:hypothetical protein
MPFDSDEVQTKIQAMEAIRRERSPLLASAIETLDAAIWVMAGGSHAQAVSLFHTAIELSLKAELDRVHRALIADRRGLEYNDLKRILRQEFAAHPRGQTLSIPPFDIDKTITFLEAIDRVADLYREVIHPWRKRLEAFHSLRNDIVHAGLREAASMGEVEAIVLVAFPFLKTFLGAVLPDGATVEGLVMRRVYREFEVAQVVAEQLRRDQRVLPIPGSVIGCLSRLVIFNRTYVAEFWDRDGYSEDEGDRDFRLGEQAKREFERDAWHHDFTGTCHLCRNHSLLVSLKLDEEKSPPQVFVQALSCFKCGLWLEGDSPRALANLHFGPVEGDEIEAFLKDIGKANLAAQVLSRTREDKAP